MEEETTWTRLAVEERKSKYRGKVHGPFGMEDIVCQRKNMLTSKGVFLGSDPLKYTMPILMMQMAVIVLTSRLVFRLLRPLKQGMISAQVLAGIILGQSGLAQNAKYAEIFLPVGSKSTLQTLSNFGLIIHIFLLGVKIDPSILRKAGSKAFLIGTASYVFPVTIGYLTVISMNKTYNLSEDLMHCLITVIHLSSMTTFPVMTTVLAELNILNSELGRLATNCSIVCEACNWLASLVSDLYRRQLTTSVVTVMWIVALLFVIVFVCRPIVMWLTERETKSTGNNREIPFFPILVIMFLVSIGAETLGVHAAFGAFWLGVSLPDGPPLGTALVTKLDVFATSLLVPCFVSIGGFETNFFMEGDGNANLIKVVILMTNGCKFFGTAVASVYCKTQIRDGLCLAFLMSCKGIIEIYALITVKDAELISTYCFNLLIITILLVTGVSRFLVVYLYDPSKRYKSASKRTILGTRQQNLQLRLLLCIYDVDNIPSLVNLLEASYPTRFSPISVCTLRLIELKGRAHSVLVPHHKMNKFDPNTAKSTHIANAFRRFEQQNQGTVMAQHFTAVAPFSSINDDVCTLALDKKATLVVIPFHKQYAIDGTIGYANPAVRNINLNVLNTAPCSVGLFIDRSRTTGCRSVLMGQTWQNVAVLFIGGRDDTEALAFCMRMVERPDFNVTMIHFKHKSTLHDSGNNIEMGEIQLVQEFRRFAMNKGKVKYREEMVRDGVETTQVIRSLGNSYDMVMVGRDHGQDLEASVLYGLTDWSECPELGVIGDVLASPDFNFSVLVIHQQPGEESLAYDDAYSSLPVTFTNGRPGKGLANDYVEAY
ncbi:PREDICTED: cation/H(+) antiporter 14-like [Tarenaya hassleriana]|uniref:cation/H(+) antiporter 14-like n=1 Tax=Tarenaya hassleriana TaxID=28532 RepID=UPI00053C944B|nr:PREDICTED: cation/H(+) antiporter 14-like [Tarenaya hassleriana]